MSVIVSDGYSLVYDKKRNKVTIALPQTFTTATSTAGELVEREVELSDNALSWILGMVKILSGGIEIKGDEHD